MEPKAKAKGKAKAKAKAGSTRVVGDRMEPNR